MGQAILPVLDLMFAGQEAPAAGEEASQECAVVADGPRAGFMIVLFVYAYSKMI